MLCLFLHQISAVRINRHISVFIDSLNYSFILRLLQILRSISRPRPTGRHRRICGSAAATSFTRARFGMDTKYPGWISACGDGSHAGNSDRRRYFHRYAYNSTPIKLLTLPLLHQESSFGCPCGMLHPYTRFSTTDLSGRFRRSSL